MRMSAWMLMASSALILTACGAADEAAPEHAGDHAAMSHEDPAASVALPDNGVTPVIDVRTTWMRPHPQGRDVTAAYFTVYLEAGAADRFIAAEVEGAEWVELHGHTVDPETGMMSMHEVGPQVLGQAGPMVFVPGGRHLMVFGLDPVNEGDEVAGRLIFERAGAVDVVFQVRSVPPGPSEY